MKTIERYGQMFGQMEEKDGGDWVRYSDHAAEVERLTAENAALKEVIYGKDPASEDPCDWGLKDQLQGAYSQRDANRDALHQARARIAELEGALEEARKQSSGSRPFYDYETP